MFWEMVVFLIVMLHEMQKMSIPVEQGDSRIFEFKTAPLQEGEGQGSLECVHQALASSPPQDHVVCHFLF